MPRPDACGGESFVSQKYCWIFFLKPWMTDGPRLTQSAEQSERDLSYMCKNPQTDHHQSICKRSTEHFKGVRTPKVLVLNQEG
jgi:hypothetical protein